MNMNTARSGRRRTRVVISLLLGVPALVLAGSYALIALRQGTWNLFPVLIHESGRYTLTETIFYFRHFVRELPVNTLVAIALGILGCLHSPLIAGDRPGPPVSLAGMRRRAGLTALVMALAAIFLTWHQLDRHETWIELAQFRTRDELSEFGSHWRYHLLHVVDSVLFCLGALLVLRGLTGAGGISRQAVRWLCVWALAFALITTGFGSPARALTDPLYLAHQAREIETHRLLALCPAFGCMLLLEQRLGAALPQALNPRMIWQGACWVAAATVIPLWIAWALRGVSIPTLAQRRVDLWQLAAAHHFEHVLDYIYVVALSLWVYLRGVTVLLRRAAPLP